MKCWLYDGYVNRLGYGVHSVGNRPRLVHRLAYEALVGPIPDGMTLDHLCRVRHCYNPAHLEPVSSVENVMRGESPQALNARKVTCKNGHPFTPENTYMRPKGGRMCRECGRAAWRAWRSRA